MVWTSTVTLKNLVTADKLLYATTHRSIIDNLQYLYDQLTVGGAGLDGNGTAIPTSGPVPQFNSLTIAGSQGVLTPAIDTLLVHVKGDFTLNSGTTLQFRRDATELNRRYTGDSLPIIYGGDGDYTGGSGGSGGGGYGNGGAGDDGQVAGAGWAITETDYQTAVWRYARHFLGGYGGQDNAVNPPPNTAAGGSIILVVEGLTTIAGKFDLSGAAGTGNEGGAAGGSFQLLALGGLAGTGGEIDVSGGAGGPGGSNEGGGAAGHIAIVVPTEASYVAPTYTIAGGAGGTPAGNAGANGVTFIEASLTADEIKLWWLTAARHN